MSQRTFSTLLILGIAMVVAGLILDQARSTSPGIIPPAPTKEPSLKPTEPPLPSGALDCIIVDRDRVRPRRGYSWTIHLNIAPSEGDRNTDLTRSNWRLFEDDQLLGEGHDRHAEIDARGAGRYSLWRRSLIFSTSDNSDPRTNGRRYELRKLAANNINSDSKGLARDLIIGLDQRLPLNGTTLSGAFLPFHGATRSEVNPAEPVPTADGLSLRFTRPGEYYLLFDGDSHRVLVLDRDHRRHADQIIAFITANTSGGTNGASASSLPVEDRAEPFEDWLRWLVTSAEPLHLNCAPTTRLALHILAEQGIAARPVRWYGSEPEYAEHVGLEYRNHLDRWVYRDPHYGIRFRADAEALDGALGLLPFGTIPEDAFEVLVQKSDWFRGSVEDVFSSYRSGLAHLDPAENDWVIYRLSETPPASAASLIESGIEILQHPRDLETFRARFYP